MSDTVVKLDTASKLSSSERHHLMVERARALAPVLRKRAERTEALRRLPPETERALHEAGLFRILQPRRLGGSELDYVALIDVAEAIAAGDASVAWNVANLASHHWMLAMFERAAQETIWGDDPDVLIASSFIFPAGHATRVTGGYRLWGHWPLSSGVEACRWNMLAAVISSDDDIEASEYRIFLVPSTAYRIVDTWASSGLCGTGSHDVALDDVFVAEGMTLPVSALAGGPTPGSSVNPGPLYRLPVFALFPFVLSGVALGNAEACLSDYTESARHRASKYNLAKIADFQAIQIKVARAGALVDSARRIMRGISAEAMEDAARGVVPSLIDKARYRRDGAYAVDLCTEAVTLLNGASGASALYRSSPIQRQFRDAHAISAHIAFNFDVAGGNFGRVALGLPSENPTL